jgi:hypothetical protein
MLIGVVVRQILANSLSKTIDDRKSKAAAVENEAAERAMQEKDKKFTEEVRGFLEKIKGSPFEEKMQNENPVLMKTLSKEVTAENRQAVHLAYHNLLEKAEMYAKAEFDVQTKGMSGDQLKLKTAEADKQIEEVAKRIRAHQEEIEDVTHLEDIDLGTISTEQKLRDLHAELKELDLRSPLPQALKEKMWILQTGGVGVEDPQAIGAVVAEALTKLPKDNKAAMAITNEDKKAWEDKEIVWEDKEIVKEEPKIKAKIPEEEERVGKTLTKTQQEAALKRLQEGSKGPSGSWDGVI